MLVLGRKIQEKICIGEDIIITVVGFDGYQVRIGIEAPKDIPVHREEIYKKIKENPQKEQEDDQNA